MTHSKVETSLRSKFISLILYNSILTTIVLVIMFGAWRYYDLYSRYQVTFENFSTEDLVGLEQSLWLMDEVQTKRQLNQLKSILDIDYIELITNQNNLSSLGIKISTPILSKTLIISRKEGNRVFDLGKIIIQLDRKHILNKLINEIIPISIIALLTVIIPLILNSLGLQKIILSRMNDLVNILNNKNKNQKSHLLKRFIQLKKHDEIDNLAQEILDNQEINEALNNNLLAQQYQLEAIFDNTKLYLGLIDKDGNALNVNKTALDYTQKSKNEILYQPVWGSIWDAYDSEVNEKIKKLTELAIKGSVVSEELILKLNHTEYHLFVNFVPLIKNGEVELVIIEAQDLTKIRRWEKQLSVQVTLLKSLVTESSYLDSLNIITQSVNQLIPADVSIHIIEYKPSDFKINILSGEYYDTEKGNDYIKILGNVLSSNFSLEQSVEYLIDYADEKNKNIGALAASLNMNKLFITPINLDLKLGNPVFVIFSLPQSYFINSFIKQTASMSSSLVELTIAKEQQLKLTALVENNLTDVMNNSLDGIVVMNDKGGIISVNERFSHLLKKPSSQLVGKNFWQLPVDLSEENIHQLINDASINKNKFSKFMLTFDNKLTKHCEITLNSIGENKNKQYYAFIQDRTDHYLLLRELEQQNQFINATLNNTTEGIIACDAQQNITVFNRAMEILHGSKEIHNKKEAWSKDYQLFELDGKTLLPLEKNPVNDVFNNNKISYPELLIKAQDSTMHRVICSGTRFYSNENKILGAVISVRDITDEYKTQQTLKNYQFHLEQLVEKRTEAMALANKELEAFAYSVSHDLRAPLRSINGFAQMFEEDYQDIIDKNGHNYLDRIKKNATQMGILIEDMLSLSKISRAEMKIEYVNISELAETILKYYQEDHAKLKMSIQGNIEVKGDPGMIKILLQNILENAVKYSKNKDQPSVNITKENIDSQDWVVITDNGIGFDDKYEQKIYQPFKRLHGKEFEGTGIGLSIVKRVINRHQGDIVINSKPQKGTRVQFHLGSHNIS